MVSSLTYDRNERELNIISEILRDLAAYLSDEHWNMNSAVTLEGVAEFFKDKPILDMLLYDVTQKGAIDYLQEWRKTYKSTQLMLIADVQTSPMDYLKPGIMASSLLLRPWDVQQVKSVLKEFVSCCIQEKGNKDGKQSYVIESREGTLNIPYEQIYFFEAKEKKIFVCTGKEEYSFYYTIDKLDEELPDQFIRCHRGFIVNAEKIRKIMLSQNTIYLADGFDIPLSRSYKSVLKEFGKR